MFKHILVPTDFGEPAERALDVAIELAKKFDSRVSILHVYPVFVSMVYGDGLPWPAEQIAAGAQKTLEGYTAKAKARYSGCESILRPGITSDQILTVAGQSNADVIVMGTHGRHGMPRFMLGSTAERVVRTSPIPVMTVSAKGDAAHVA
jgi:nucleotide-binding universal stress UspA family protein